MKILRFNEVNLSLGELSKPSNKNRLRGDILIKKLKARDNLLFKTKNLDTKSMKILNSDDIVDNISSDSGYDPVKASLYLKSGKRYNHVFSGEDGVIYKLSDIEKTADFGSGSGSSLGSSGTKESECLQCVFLAVRQHLGREVTEEDIDIVDESTGQIKSEYLEFLRLPSGFSVNPKVIDNYLNNDKWLNTFIKIANAMYDDTPVFTKEKDVYERVLKSEKKYIFHHNRSNSVLLNTITRKYSELRRGNIPIPKWSPADVWAIDIDKEKTIIPLLEKSESFFRFNSIINGLFTSNDLRGISLKKVANNEESIRIIINRLTPIPKYKFDNVIISDDPFSNIGIRVSAIMLSDYIDEKFETIGFRTFGGNTPSDISGEVDGDSAKHGKIGLIKINHFINLINDEMIFDIGPMPTIPIKNNIDLSDEELQIEITRLNNLIKDLKAVVSRKTNKIFLSRSGLISKYQSLLLAKTLFDYSDQILKDKQTASDRLIEKIFYYAMSIKNDEFDCPKYVRIV